MTTELPRLLADQPWQVSNPNSWALAVVWAVPQAVWNNWCALMVISLTKVHHSSPHSLTPIHQISMDGEFLSETWVSQLGLVAVLVSTATAITVGTCIGRIRGSMKTTILGLLVAGGAMFSLLSLVTLKVLDTFLFFSLKHSLID